MLSINKVVWPYNVFSLSILGLLLLFPVKEIEVQSTPTEFAELSLQELFNQSIGKKRNVNNTKWTMGYHFSAVEYEGYLDGTIELFLDEVLWSGPSEPRTQMNYF